MNSKSKYSFIIKLSSLFLVLYLFGVVIITIVGQSKLKESRTNEFNLQVENSLITIESFLEIQKENLKLLSSNKSIESYFINKALGMSLKYGLRANIIKIDSILEEFIKTKQINGIQLFDSVVLLNNNYKFISKNRLNLDFDKFNNISNEVQIISYENNSELEVYLVKNIITSGKKVGLLVGKLNFKAIANQLLFNFRSKHSVFLQQDNDVFYIENLKLHKDAKEIRKDTLTDNISDSQIEVLIKQPSKEEFITSPYFVLGLIILSFMVFYGIYFILRLNRKNRKLNTRIADTKKLNAILEEKVNEKTKELKEFNEHLKYRVKEEVIKNRDNQRIIYNQSKMAMMGQMLDNIAHQWRQPLSSISTNASGVKLQNELNLLDKDRIDYSMDNIVDSTKFLSETIDDFRDFFKENKDKKLFKVQDTYERTRKLLVSAMKHSSIELVEDIENIQVLGYSNELIQVLLNIINNANDAFNENSDVLDRKFVFISMQKDNENLVVKIKDNAGGIPEEIIEKVFDSKFTTKADNKGTGIGLYMTKEIIESHMRGKIEVENRSYTFEDCQCVGAEFIIEIPLNT